MALMLSVMPALADTDNNKTTIEVLQEILTSQNVSTVQKLDCTKVTDEQFADLGDAFMEEAHPGDAHEAMDKMMGGEGSASLTAIHISMGQRYLGCAGSTVGYGMMGGGMMGGYYNNRSGNYSYGPGYGMMGYYNSDDFGARSGWFLAFPIVTMILVWVLLIVAIIVLIKVLKRKK